MRSRLVALIFLLSAGLGPNAVLAEEEDDDDSEEEDLEEARELYEVGNAHYAAGRYEKAAAAFLKGYELSELPGFLYNLANAYERMGNYAEAAARLELYLESPKAKDVVSVRERVRRLKAAAEDRERELRKQKAREELARKMAAREGNDGGDDARYEVLPREPTYLYFLAGGAVLAGAGGVFALVGQSAASSASTKCQGTICPREAQGDLDREKTMALLADLSFGGAIVVAGIGVYLYLKGPPRRRIDESANGAGVEVVPLVGDGAVGFAAVGWF